MGRAKNPSEWTPAYRQRMENFFQKNPHGTLTEARRGINSKEIIEAKQKAEASPYDKSMYNLKHKEGNLTLKESLDKISKEESLQQKKLLREMAQNVKTQWETNTPGTRAFKETKEKLHKQYVQAEEWDLYGEENDDYDFIAYSGGDE